MMVRRTFKKIKAESRDWERGRCLTHVVFRRISSGPVVLEQRPEGKKERCSCLRAKGTSLEGRERGRVGTGLHLDVVGGHAVVGAPAFLVVSQSLGTGSVLGTTEPSQGHGHE